MIIPCVKMHGFLKIGIAGMPVAEVANAHIAIYMKREDTAAGKMGKVVMVTVRRLHYHTFHIPDSMYASPKTKVCSNVNLKYVLRSKHKINELFPAFGHWD